MGHPSQGTYGGLGAIRLDELGRAPVRPERVGRQPLPSEPPHHLVDRLRVAAVQDQRELQHLEPRNGVVPGRLPARGCGRRIGRQREGRTATPPAIAASCRRRPGPDRDDRVIARPSFAAASSSARGSVSSQQVCGTGMGRWPSMPASRPRSSHSWWNRLDLEEPGHARRPLPRPRASPPARS